jgi:D-3-phosphoglycerate dehydrogenase
MISKALFIDFKREEIPSEYFERVKKVSASQEFISRDDAELVGFLFDAEIILGKFSTKVGKEVIDASPKLKYIGVLGTAFDAVDVHYAKQKSIIVCNLGGYSTEAVSEFFFAILFEATRELERAKQQARSGDYSSKLMGVELKDKILGVVGAGKIGSRTAKIGLGIGMKVIYFDQENKPELDKLGAERRGLDKVLSDSNFISLNLVLNKETEGIISKEKIALMRSGCVFINLAPPTLVDQEAMIERAEKGEITFVFDHSDDLDPSLAKRFLGIPNCLVYPSIGFRTKEANTAKWEIFTSNIEKFTQGIPQNVVN